jgi:FkbM family methyltransferase
MKQLLLGTALGRTAISLRESLDVVKSALFHPENVGMLSNDLLAAKLVTILCKSNKVFIDLGAHIGSIVSEVAHNDPSISIVAVVAIPDKVANLRRKFPRIEIHSCALGESVGEVPFFVHRKRSGYSSLRKPSDSDRSDVIEIKVPLRRLDDLISSDLVDVIKIDVEGAELGVLRGSTRLIGSSRPTILFESAPGTGDGLSRVYEGSALEVVCRSELCRAGPQSGGSQ